MSDARFETLLKQKFGTRDFAQEAQERWRSSLHPTARSPTNHTINGCLFHPDGHFEFLTLSYKTTEANSPYAVELALLGSLNMHQGRSVLFIVNQAQTYCGWYVSVQGAPVNKRAALVFPSQGPMTGPVFITQYNGQTRQFTDVSSAAMMSSNFLIMMELIDDKDEEQLSNATAPSEASEALSSMATAAEAIMEAASSAAPAAATAAVGVPLAHPTSPMLPLLSVATTDGFIVSDLFSYPLNCANAQFKGYYAGTRIATKHPASRTEPTSRSGHTPKHGQQGQHRRQPASQQAQGQQTHARHARQQHIATKQPAERQ
jgi:hypothetical protein